MSKIGLYTDLHLHLWKSYGRDSVEGLPTRFLEQIDVLEQIKETFLSHKCELVIDGGDGYHIDTAIPIECINVRSKFSRDLKKAGIVEEIVEGNHTISKKKNPSWLNRSYYSSLLDDRDGDSPSKELIFNGCKIKLLGYSDETDINTIKNFDIVVVHKQPTVTNSHGFKHEGVDWKILSKNNRLVFFGHYHVNQQLSDNCWIMGPPMHLNFGDSGPRGVWIVDTKTWNVEFIKLKYPEFITVETPELVKDDTNYYRVLHSDKKIKSDRVVSAVVPEFFEERIKSDDFIQILSEWVSLNNKPKYYFDSILSFVKTKSTQFKNIYKGQIKSVEINNFFSIEHVKYDVEKGFHIVIGKNADFDSNGAGKTTLFEAIYWCFFGKTTKGGLRADELIRDGEKDCQVVVRLSDGDSNLTIFRSKKEGLRIWNENKPDNIEMTEGKTKPECEKILNDVLGFDEKVYLASCYFSQENVLMLTGLGDADRTNMITDLLGFETYDDLHKECAQKIKDLQIKQTSLESEKTKIEGDINWLNSKIVDLNKRGQDVDSQLSDKSYSISKKNEELLILVNQLNGLQPPKVDLLDINSRIENIESQILECKSKFELFKKTIEDAELNKKEVQQSSSTKYNEYWGLCSKREIYVKELKSINETHSHKSGQFCSSCGAVINEANKENFIADRNEKIQTFDDAILICKSQHNRLVKQLEDAELALASLVESSKQQQSQIDRLHIDLRESNVLKTQIQNQANEYEMKKLSLERQIESFKQLISQLQSDYDRIAKSKDSIASDIQIQKNQIQNLDARKITIDAELIANRDTVAMFDFWSTSFLPSGIRSVLLDRFCNEFNQILNEYLSLISNGTMGIIVSPTKKTGSGSERNKIGILIDNNGKERNYLGLSGGEKRRVDISLCLGLNKWVSKKYNLQNGLLGIVIFDELFSFIDRLGEETIGNLLYQEGVNSSIYVISHTPEIGSYTRSVLTVIKENGVSRLETCDASV